MAEKIHITVDDMIEAIEVCDRLAAERDPVMPRADSVTTRVPSRTDEREARALRLAAALMRTSTVGTIVVPDQEVRHD